MKLDETAKFHAKGLKINKLQTCETREACFRTLIECSLIYGSFKCLGMFFYAMAFEAKHRCILRKRLDVSISFFRLVNTLYYSLNNKKETLKDWKDVKKMSFLMFFFNFSPKKIGYILKIHKFAPSRTLPSV